LLKYFNVLNSYKKNIYICYRFRTKQNQTLNFIQFKQNEIMNTENSENKAKDISLLEDKNNIALFFDSVLEGIICIDNQFNIRFFSKGAEQMFGYKKEEIIGKHLNTLIADQFHVKHNKHIHQFAHSEVSKKMMNERERITGKRKNNEIFVAEASIAISIFNNEKFFTAIIRDVSLNVQLENELEKRKNFLENELKLSEAKYTEQNKIEIERSEYKLRLLFETMAQGAIYQSIDGKIIEANKAAFSILGLNFEEIEHCIQNKSNWKIIDNNNNVLIAPKHPVLFAFENDSDVNTLTISFFNPKTNNYRWVLLHSAKLDLQKTDSYKLIFTTFEDITNQKLAEQQILTLLKKERDFNLMRSNFITLASHQFRTPLTVLYSNTELLELLINNSNSDFKNSAQKYLTKIYDELRNFDNTLNDILLMEKVETGNIAFQPRPIDIVDFCTKITNKSFEYQNNRKIKITSAGEAFTIHADSNILGQAINNLISNAYKFSETETEIHILFTENAVQISISDKGLGISDADKPEIFKSFFRASSASDKRGSGLGLLIAKECIEMHNGTIGVESKLNEGSVFTIELPRNSFK